MLQLDPQIHHARETSLADWLRREFPRVDLFTFFNSDANVWEIGRLRPNGMVDEMCIIGPLLSMFDISKAHQLRDELTRAPRQEQRLIRQDVFSRQRGRDREAQESSANHREWLRSFIRRHRLEHNEFMCFKAGLI